MARKLDKSKAQLQRAMTRLPLGVASNFRYWGDERTIYVAKGKGARIWDIDGNEYVDYRLGYGPAILGFAHPEVDAAAREGMEVGGVFALATEREYVVADRIAKMVRSVDLVRFSNSGTEAVMAALRVARAYTGKDSYVIIEGGYHGLFDAALWQTDLEGWDGVGEPGMRPYGEGVPKLVRQLLYRTPLNDAQRLEDLLRRHGSEIGALLIEPIMGNCCSLTATPDYLRTVRALCDKYEIVLIIDEVKTGFRVARGGVQELFGVDADLCTFAKAVGNGYPISIIAGREEIMRKIGRGVTHGGTYTAHSISLAAAEKCLQILDETDALERIAAYGRRMQAGMGAILERRGLPYSFIGHPSMGGLIMSAKPPQNYREWKTSDYTLYDTIAREVQDRCILCEPDSREPWFVSAAHDEQCLTDTLNAFEEAVDAALVALSRPERARASAGH
ncbi:MAG: aminotransferase class III-fold pyridoxal phosphate-dependent enzyme [Geminicoccaceae bacterium]